MIDHDEIERAARRFDVPEDAFERFTDRHRRRQRNHRIGTAVVALAIAVAGIGIAVVALHRSPTVASRPQPHRGVVPLAPLCGHPENGSLVCPRTPPAGDYRSALSGFSHSWPFTFTLSEGWQVDEIPGGNGLDLRKRGTDVGVSIIVYPHGPRGRDLPGPKELARWVARRPYVISSPFTRTEFDGKPAWQVDVRPRDSARQVSDCRVSATCVPLLGLAYPPPGDARVATGVALLPQTPSRLIFFGGQGKIVVGIWIWNAGSGPGGGIDPDIQRLVDSLRFEAL